MIPRIFHQVWVGSNPCPEEFEPYRESWQRLHPDWEYRFWTEDNITDLRRPEAYDQARVPAERADIIRLDVVWKYGGVYMDTDFECRQPLDELIRGIEFFTALLKPGGNVNNAILGATPQHPLLDRALRELCPSDVGSPYDKSAAGPLFFNKLVQGRPEVTIFPAELFYPTTSEQRENAYAVHHAARSWKDSDGWRQTALRAEERLEKERKTLEKERRTFEKERRAHEKTKKALEGLKAEVATLKARAKDAEKRAGSAGGASEEDRDGAALRRGAKSFLRARS